MAALRRVAETLLRTKRSPVMPVGHPLLRQAAAPVPAADLGGVELKALVNRMVATMRKVRPPAPPPPPLFYAPTHSRDRGAARGLRIGGAADWRGPAGMARGTGAPSG